MRAPPSTLVVLLPALVLGGCQRSDRSSNGRANESRAPSLGGGVTQEQPPSEAPALPPPPAAPAPAVNGAEAQGAPMAGSPRLPEVVNAGDVKRFDNESTLGFVETTLTKSVIAHMAPEEGAEVALLVGGTNVVQVAEHDGSILVTFPDPRDATRRQMGWVPANAINVAPKYPCRRPQVAFQGPFGSFCATPCQQARDCGAGESCVQGGIAVERNGMITNLIMYCVAR